MRRFILVLVAALAVTIAVACVKPPPVPPPVVSLFKEIFHSTVPDPSGVHAPPDPHSCAITGSVADASLHAQYKPVDTYWYANGWSFWTSCVVTARTLGFSLPFVKDNGMPNSQVLDPRLTLYLDTAPVLGVGSGHYASFAATSAATWGRAYIEVQG